VKVREYRELEAGNRSPTFEKWDRICKLYRVAADVRGGFQKASHRSRVGTMKKWIVVPLVLVAVLLTTVAATYHHGGYEISVTS
jgi:hypothetical protein